MCVLKIVIVCGQRRLIKNRDDYFGVHTGGGRSERSAISSRAQNEMCAPASQNNRASTESVCCLYVQSYSVQLLQP